MDAFKGKYERTSADQYDEFMKVYAFDDGNDINDGDDDDDYCVLDYEAYNWDSSWIQKRPKYVTPSAEPNISWWLAK